MTKWGLYDCEDECKEDEEEKQDLVPLIPLMVSIGMREIH